MKIVTWNCRSNFANKFRKIKELNADIYVIQECESPFDTHNIDYKNFGKGSLWKGSQKGVGIFVKEGNTLSNLEWDDGPYGHFIACSVNDEQKLVGMWVKGDENSCYAPVVLEYLKMYATMIDQNTILAGDMNLDLSVSQRQSSRTQTIQSYKLLESKGLVSAYHSFFEEPYAYEKRKTYYHHCKIEKPSSHIDYVFIKKDRIVDVKLEDPDKWISSGDHIPLVVEFNS